MEGKELIRKKRTQRDYTLPFKLAVVSAVEKELTDSKQLCLLYDEILNIINREHGIDLRKKLLSKQLDTYNSIKK